MRERTYNGRQKNGGQEKLIMVKSDQRTGWVSVEVSKVNSEKEKREGERESRGLRHSRRRHAGRVVMQIVGLVERERGTSRRGEEDGKVRTNHMVVVEDIWQPRNT